MLDYNAAHEKDLNKLFNGLRVTQPAYTISLTNLFHTFAPDSYREFALLINEHSKMSLNEIATYCFDNQHKYTLSRSYTKKEMAAYTWHLFVIKSFDGFNKEAVAVTHLENYVTSLEFKTDNVIDAAYAVDITVYKAGRVVAGIQVKPESYRNLPPHIHAPNLKKNNSFSTMFGATVFYLYYSKAGKFTDFPNLISQLKKI